MVAHPNPNLNNKHAQLVYSGETSYPTYAMEIKEINLRSGRVLPDGHPPYPPEYLEEEKEDGTPPANATPYPERLAIKYVPIYNNIIKEEFFKRHGKIRRDAPTINVVGNIFDLILGRVISPKYLDLGSQVVNVKINNIVVPNTLNDLGAAINVMTNENMLKLKLEGALTNTTTVLQLVDRSTTSLEGFIEDVMVSIDSWEYPTTFIFIHTMTNFSGYPLILGRPWLATADV
eukprot:PITA_04053